jgi:glycosyltransferase involved in cell wall biosynthesis
MRLLFLVHEYPPVGGGGGVGVRLLAEALARRHRVIVLTTGPEALETESGSLRVNRLFAVRGGCLGAREWLRFAGAAISRGIALCRRERPDLISAHFAVPAGLAGIVLQRFCSIPCVISTVGADIHDPTRRLSPTHNRLTRGLVRHTLRHAAAVTAISQDLAARCAALSGKSVDALLPYPAEAPSAPVARRPPPPFRWISVCRHVRRKRLDLLLEAAAIIRDLAWELHLVGDGPESEALRRKARELEVVERVIFHGFVPDSRKWELLGQAHGFVMVSEHEAQGLAYLEAMRFGLPVIAAEEGGQRDFVRHGEEGLLAPLNSEAIAGAMRRLMRDEELRERMGQAARQRAELYGVDRVAQRWEGFFQRLVES